MTEFSATDAAFEGFRLTRERPGAVAVWAGFLLLGGLVFGALAVALGGEALNSLMRAGERGQPDPREMMAAFGRLAPLALIAIPLSLLYYAMLYSAVYRAILRPGEGGPGFLRLGGDELRVAGALVALFLLALVAGIVFAVGAGLLAQAGQAMGGAGRLIGLLGALAMLGLAIWIAVRLSLALPMTFHQRRIRVFESWPLTRGRFWPLLGAYVLALVLILVVSLLALLIYFAVAVGVAGGPEAAAQGLQPDYSSFATWLAPAAIVFLVFNALLNAITNAVGVAPAALAYRDLAGVAPHTA